MVGLAGLGRCLCHESHRGPATCLGFGSAESRSARRRSNSARHRSPALVLAGPELWPRGRAGGVDWVALLLVALALVLLLGARWRVLSVIGAAALVGVGRWLWLGL